VSNPNAELAYTFALTPTERWSGRSPRKVSVVSSASNRGVKAWTPCVEGSEPESKLAWLGTLHPLAARQSSNLESALATSRGANRSK
jgi:hypothetical protein